MQFYLSMEDFLKKGDEILKFFFRRRSRQEKIIFKEHPSILTHDLLIDSFYHANLVAQEYLGKKCNSVHFTISLSGMCRVFLFIWRILSSMSSQFCQSS